MTECLRGCGQCCEVVWFRLNRVSVAQQIPMTRGDARKDLQFIKKHWKQDMKAPIRRDPTDNATPYFAYKCDMFDPVARDCNAHESRPPICSNFPWYGRQVTADTRIDPILTGCTFWNDIDRDNWPEGVKPLTRAMLPLTVISAQQRKDATMTEPQFDVVPDPSLVTPPGSVTPEPQFDVDPAAGDVTAPNSTPMPQFDVVPVASEVTAPDPNAAPGEPGS